MTDAISERENDTEAMEHNQESEGDTLQWSVHPFRENLMKSLFLLIILALLFCAIYWGTDGDIFLTGLSMLIMSGTLSPYFFVTKYEMDATSVRQKRGQMINKKRWSDFRRYYIGKTHITLSPFTYTTRLESFRSMTLLVNSQNRDRIEAFVRKHMPVDEEERETLAEGLNGIRGGPPDQTIIPAEDREA